MNNRENNVIDTIVEKANTALQALNNVETKGRPSLNNLCGAIDLLEQIINMSIGEINRLQSTIEEFKSAVNDIKKADNLQAQLEKSTNK